MGTRHLQTVIDKDGNMKLSQYGQWDGYPSGQGLDILRFLLLGNLEKYEKNLSKIHLINEQEQKQYYFLSRDCGSRIHKLIELGKVPFVIHIDEAEARQHCEGFYTIDFQKRKFTSEFNKTKKTFSLDNLPTMEEYLIKMRVEKENIAGILKSEEDEANLPKTAKGLAKHILNKLKDKEGDRIKTISDILPYSDHPSCEVSLRIESKEYSVYKDFNVKNEKVANELINLLKEAKVTA